MLTLAQVEQTAETLGGGGHAFISVFAGRIADTGRDPVPIMARGARDPRAPPEPRAALGEPARDPERRAGRRDRVPRDHRSRAPLLDKLDWLGRDLDDVSLDTVRMFHRDAELSGYSL